MATTQFQVTANADREQTSGSRALAPGTIRGVSLQIIATGSDPAPNFVRVLIEELEAGASVYQHIILQEYVSRESGANWTGNFPLGENVQITAQIMSSTNAVLVVSITTDDI